MIIKRYLSIFVLIYCHPQTDVVETWTKLCPQSNLNELCKCSPGEHCCFCPNPRQPLSDKHWSRGNNAEMFGNPCSAMVSSNGCTVGGICPPCGGLNLAFTNDIRVDEPVCAGLGLTRTLCSVFDNIRYRCANRLHKYYLWFSRHPLPL